MIEWVKPTYDAVKYIADNMREADVAEVWASNRHTPVQAVMRAWQDSSFSIVGMVDDTPCVILGLVRRDMLSGIGIPWLLGTQDALKHSRAFVKTSSQFIDEMLSICPSLFNYVHADNIASIRWLKWSGFTLDESIPHGPNGELFHRFHLERL